MKNRIIENSEPDGTGELRKASEVFSVFTRSSFFSPVVTSFFTALIGFVFFIVQQNYISSAEDNNYEAKFKSEFKTGEIECLLNIDDAFLSLLSKPDSKEFDSALTMHLIHHKKFIIKQKAVMLTLQKEIDTSIFTEINKYHELISNIQFDLKLNAGDFASEMDENPRIIYENIILKLRDL